MAKTKELTSQATSKGTRAINIDKSLREFSVLYRKSLVSPSALITWGRPIAEHIGGLAGR